MSIKIKVPIYYTQNFKTKKDKKFLVGLNWFRNAHYLVNNQVKKHYHDLVIDQILRGYNGIKLHGKVSVHYDVFVKTHNTDGPNVRSVIEKYVLDGLVKAGVIEEDNVKILVADSSCYYIDKEDPRVEITVSNYSCTEMSQYSG